MKIILKSSFAPEQLESRKRIKEIDGLEMQMLQNVENFSILNNMPKNIYNIHCPIEEEVCNFSNILNKFNNKDFLELVSYAENNEINIVMHNDISYIELLRHPQYSVFIKFLKRTKVKFLLENIPTEYSTNLMCTKEVLMDIPTICSDLNMMAGRNCLFPLLDIAHLMMNFNTSLLNSYSYASVINAFNSSNFFVHLNAVDGYGKNKPGKILHGLDFENNPILLKKLLIELYNVNPAVNLVLEVLEDDYTNPVHAEFLKNEIIKTRKQFNLY